MSTTAHAASLIVCAVNALAAASGGALWWRVDPRPAWWPLLRVAQVTAALGAVAAGVLYLRGFRPSDDLYWLYVGLPLALGSVAEQLRVVAAQTILDARGLPDAQAVGRLPADRQRSVVVAILRREMGIMALSALAIAFLALRAYVEV